MLDPSVFAWMSKNPAPVLTWYTSEGRLEFTGPVMVRWIAKTANYVVEMFGEEAAVALGLPASWRTLVWATGAAFAGASVSVSDNSDLSVADLFVTADEDAASRAASEDPGLVVLLQDLGMMSFGWAGDLPSGVEDAIFEVNIQPDSLVVDVVPASLPIGEEVPAPAQAEGTEVIVGSPYMGRVWQAWSEGRAVVWIEEGLDVDRILSQEQLV
ncbi:MAG: TIGR03089 family protein [Actinomycetaceae bacterium]|nr:TIGR03089 family protein [Actinomycetaceae bacterium]